MDDYNEDDYFVHMNVVYRDDEIDYTKTDVFHCMDPSEMKEIYDAYENHNHERFQVHGPLRKSPVYAANTLTEDCDASLHGHTDPLEYFKVTLPAKRKQMEQYEIDIDKHRENKKALDLLKTMKSSYELEMFLDKYSNALETVRDFFRLYSEMMSTEEKQWGQNEVEYMRTLRQAMQDKNTRIYNEHKQRIDAQMTLISRTVQLDDNERQKLDPENVGNFSTQELKKLIYSSIRRTETLDRENCYNMGVLIQNMELFLRKYGTHILEDNAWKEQASEYMRFVQCRQNRSKMDLLKLDTSIMQITDLAKYKDTYSSISSAVQEYLSTLGHVQEYLSTLGHSYRNRQL